MAEKLITERARAEFRKRAREVLGFDFGKFVDETNVFDLEICEAGGLTGREIVDLASEAKGLPAGHERCRCLSIYDAVRAQLANGAGRPPRPSTPMRSSRSKRRGNTKNR